MNENQLTVSKIINGLIIYIVASFLTSIFSSVSSLSDGASFLSGEVPSIGALDIIVVIVNIAVIYGIYLYYQGLQGLAVKLDPVGSAAAKNLSYGAMLMMIAALFSAIGVFVPIFASVIAGLCLIAAFILNILGYANLQKSTTFNELGTAGAKQLYMGFVFAIIAVCVGWIPLIGWVAAFVLNILYWVYLFLGWGKIRTSMGD